MKYAASVVGITFLIIFFLSCLPQKLKTLAPPQDRHAPYNFVSRKGMVVAAHPLAAEAGLKMLKKGGNAVDAAVATAFTLNVVEPFASGIGGGGFMVIYLAQEKKATVINFREKAPRAASPFMFDDKGEAKEEWRTSRGTAVAVPGALAGWNYALKKYGTKSLAETTESAMDWAEKGFRVSQTFSSINKEEYEKILQNAGETSCYLNQGVPYEPGDDFRNPDLARTLKLLASKGIQEFYKGEIAQKIVAAVQAKDGIMTLQDIENYSPKEVKPLKGTYKGYTFYTIPPPGSGGLHIIQLLNIIENWPVQKWGHNSPVYIHHLSQAIRFIFADHDAYLGDPDFISIPLENLLSKEYAREIVQKIKPEGLADSYRPGKFEERKLQSENTTQVCVIDKEGNIVSLTQSINYFFGSGIVPEGTGFLLNNHMDDFALTPHSPNSPNSGCQPVSFMGPLIIFQQEKPLLALGSPGGQRIFPSLVQIILNIIEFRMTLDEAIEAPRFFAHPSEGEARSISVESRFPEITIKALENLGHKISVKEDFDKFFGGAQGIMIDRAKKIILGGADSRRDGWGAGY